MRVVSNGMIFKYYFMRGQGKCTVIPVLLTKHHAMKTCWHVSSPYTEFSFGNSTASGM